MTTSLLHPDQLTPGNLVGPWRILEPLGSGGGGRAFKVEHETHPGQPYTLKVALRPDGQFAPEEEDVAGRLSREAAFHMAYATGLKVHSVDHWLGRFGYLYFVTDYVEGETFTEWCWRVKPTAARLLEVFTEVVRLLDGLHRRGLFHRDLKGANILIRKADEHPQIIDFGVARQPGMATLTEGVPPTSPHLVPPECVRFITEGTWKQGARFEPGVPGDLYALGALLYEALTDGYAFDPRMPPEQLVLAIATKMPPAPHVLNPKAPKALSDIALRLLAKRPEDRYASAEALLQALWEAAKEKKKPEWHVSLEPPLPEESAPAAPGEAAASNAPAAPEESSTSEVPEAGHEPASDAPRIASMPPLRRQVLKWALRALSVLFLAVWLGVITLGAPPEKGSPAMPTALTPHAPSTATPRAKLAWRAATLMCAVTGLACTGTPVKPEAADCPSEAQETMFQVLKLRGDLSVVIDINQPGDNSQLGTYRDGAVVSRVVGYSFTEPALPDGTRLYGRLWVGPGVVDEFGHQAVVGRYTEARLPDGRTFPVCIALGGPQGAVRVRPESKPGAALLPREVPASAVRRWP